MQYACCPAWPPPSSARIADGISVAMIIVAWRAAARAAAAAAGPGWSTSPAAAGSVETATSQYSRRAISRRSRLKPSAAATGLLP